MRRGGLTIALLVTALLVTVLSVAGCDDAKKSISEFALRNTAATAGVAAFKDKNVDVDGLLKCTAASASDGKTGTVNCTGTAKDGRPLTLTGNYNLSSSKSKIKGQFTGKAGNTVVF